MGGIPAQAQRIALRSSHTEEDLEDALREQVLSKVRTRRGPAEGEESASRGARMARAGGPAGKTSCASPYIAVGNIV